MENKIVAILITTIMITSIFIMTLPSISASEEEIWSIDIYKWDSSGEYWAEATWLSGLTLCENTTFTLKVVRNGDNFNSDSIPIVNASVRFWTETKNTNATGEVTFITPAIYCEEKLLKMYVAIKDAKGVKYNEYRNDTWTYIMIKKCKNIDSGRIANFHRTNSEGYTTKFNITGQTWRVEWAYSTSSEHPYFAYNLLDTHGHIIHGCSSSDAKYNSHGVVYLEGQGEDFYFQVWDANLRSWSIDVYQEVYPDEE